MGGFDFSTSMSSMARERLETSAIGEMIKLTAENEAISFTAGEPSADLLPMDELKAAFSEVFDDAAKFGYYWSDLGHIELRRWIFDWMCRDALLPNWVTPEHIIMTCGSQEGLNLAAEALIDPGSIVAVESPTYMETLLTFRKQGAVCIGVRMDESGIVPEALEDLLRCRHVRFLYSIPNFQNPTGYTASAERRLEVLAILRRHDIPLLEDDPYRHLSYEGPPPASYISLAGDDARVIYLGSFSKIIAPGVRTGWMVVPDSLVDKMAQLRVNACLGLPIFVQDGLWRMLLSMDIGERLSKLRNAYRVRRDGLLAAFGEFLGDTDFSFNSPSGGFFVWGKLPGVDDMADFARYAVLQEKVGVVPGRVFYVPGDEDESTMRFSFAKTDPETARDGAQRLARAIKSYGTDKKR